LKEAGRSCLEAFTFDFKKNRFLLTEVVTISLRNTQAPTQMFNRNLCYA